MTTRRNMLRIFWFLGGLLALGSMLWAQSEFKPREYIIDDIHIDGNTQFTVRYLKKQLGLKEKRLLKKHSTFTRRLLELDRLSLETVYVKNGFLDCSVADSFSTDQNSEVDLFFSIREGRQYYLKEIMVEGNENLKTDQLLRMLDHAIGAPYNTIKIKNGIREIKAYYANIGKPLAIVDDSISTNGDIGLFIHIKENPTMKVGNIAIVNNDQVRDKSILREIVLKEGDLYSQQKIELSKRHIFETGLFSSVSIKFADVDTAHGELDLLVDVREMRMRYFGFDLGMGQDKGISGSEPYTSIDFAGEWFHRNILKRGSRLSTAFTTSINLTNILVRPKTEAEILYIEPWMWGFRSATSFRIFVNNQVLPEQAITKYGGEIALTYKPDKRVFLQSGIEINGIRFRTEQYETTINESDRERALTFALRRDYRDNFLYPGQGTVLTANAKLVGLMLGGTQDYYKLETAFSQYLTLIGPFVFAYRFKVGWMDAFWGEEAPKYEKFYLGGATSMRGWRDREFILTDGKPQGADLKVLTNAEIRFPLFWRLGAELFIDGGNLASDIKSLSNQHFRLDVGLGLTIATPLGPMRVDYAKILNPSSKKEIEKPWQFQFSIPYAF